MSRALLIIDVQESFRHRPIWRTVSDPKIADHLRPLVRAARAAGDEVIWVLHSEPGSGGPFDPSWGFVTIMPALAPEPREHVLTKTSHNAFTTTNLQQLLTSRGITELLITGCAPSSAARRPPGSPPTSATRSPSCSTAPPPTRP